MNNLGFNSASTNIFGQDLDSSSSPEFQSVKVNKVVLKGQDVDIENLEADDGVVFYDRFQYRICTQAKLRQKSSSLRRKLFWNR